MGIVDDYYGGYENLAMYMDEDGCVDFDAAYNDILEEGGEPYDRVGGGGGGRGGAGGSAGIGGGPRGGGRGAGNRKRERRPASGPARTGPPRTEQWVEKVVAVPAAAPPAVASPLAGGVPPNMRDYVTANYDLNVRAGGLSFGGIGGKGVLTAMPVVPAPGGLPPTST